MEWIKKEAKNNRQDMPPIQTAEKAKLQDISQITLVTKDKKQSMPELKMEYGVPYFSFPGLEATGVVKHLFSTRLGGVSRNEFASMNLSFTRGDEEALVMENYRRIAKVLDCQPQDMVATYQTHTKNLRVVTSSDCGNGVTSPKQFMDIDGLLTREKGVVLLAYFADCVPLFLVDPVEKCIALCHSGWKGTMQAIGYEAVLKMQKEFGSRPENIHAAIGPSICRDCYEVSEDLLDAFAGDFWKRFGTETAEFLRKKEKRGKSTGQALFTENENGKYQLDLWLANRLIFQKAGVLPENLEVTNVCTCCNPQLLYSHRWTKGKRGNLCAFLALK